MIPVAISFSDFIETDLPLSGYSNQGQDENRRVWVETCFQRGVCRYDFPSSQVAAHFPKFA